MELIGFHGSRKRFDHFSLKYFGQSDAGQWGKGVYFSNKKEVALCWGNIIYKCKLRLNKPFIVRSGNKKKIDYFLSLGETTKESTDRLREMGYDGIISYSENWYVSGDSVEADQYVVFNPDVIEILEVEEVDEDEEMDEAFETHDKLNPKIFDNSTKKMKKEVRERLIEIADKFVESLEEDGVPLKVYDYWVLGSNAAYNYTSKSDIDTHVIVNMEDVDVAPEVLTILYNYAKSKFNDDYDITIKGQEVELYIEDINTSAISNGVYSLKRDKWIKEPEPMEESSIDITNEDEYKKWDSRFNNVIESGDIEKLQSFVDDIYILRKDSLAKDGEFGLGNLIFKEMRNQDKLQQIKDKIKELESKELTLEGLKNSGLQEKQERTVYNAWQAWPQYRQKYGKTDSFFELQHNFHLTKDEMKWILDRAIKYSLIDEYTRDYVVSYLKLNESLSRPKTASKNAVEYKNFFIDSLVFSGIEYKGEKHPGFTKYFILDEDGSLLSDSSRERIEQELGIKCDSIKDCKKVIDYIVKNR